MFKTEKILPFLYEFLSVSPFFNFSRERSLLYVFFVHSTNFNKNYLELSNFVLYNTHFLSKTTFNCVGSFSPLSRNYCSIEENTHLFQSQFIKVLVAIIRLLLLLQTYFCASISIYFTFHNYCQHLQ